MFVMDGYEDLAPSDDNLVERAEDFLLDRIKMKMMRSIYGISSKVARKILRVRASEREAARIAHEKEVERRCMAQVVARREELKRRRARFIESSGVGQ